MNYFQLLAKFGSVYSKNCGKTLTRPEIVRKLNRAINLRDVKIKGIDSISILGNTFDISGLYDSELDSDNKPPISIELQFPEHKKEFKLDKTDLSSDHWLEMSVDIASVIGHEFVHMKQYRRRQFNDGRYYTSKSKNIIFKEQQEYYGTPDEVDAYAYTLAVALINQKVFHSKKKPAITKTQVYKIYCHYFGRNSDITQRLIKKSKTYYRHLEKEYHEFNSKK